MDCSFNEIYVIQNSGNEKILREFVENFGFVKNYRKNA